MESWNSSTAAPSGRMNQQGPTVERRRCGLWRNSSLPPPPDSTLSCCVHVFSRQSARMIEHFSFCGCCFCAESSLHSCTIKSVQLGGRFCWSYDPEGETVGGEGEARTAWKSAQNEWYYGRENGNTCSSGSKTADFWACVLAINVESCHATTNNWHNFRSDVCFG